MTDTQVAKKAADTPARRQPERQEEPVHAPNVDITENDDRVRLMADMPGVDPDSVEVTIEKNVLTIEGRGRVEGLADHALAGQEFAVGQYRRDFTISEAIDPAGIKARVKHGVVDVTLPKREQVKARKIAIES
jgi:HSP20 family protein